MIPVTPTEEDQKILENIAQNVVLKRWAKRCGKDCADEWNATIGKIVGMNASE